MKNHDYLTRDMRETLRALIDERQRQLLYDRQEPTCKGCGGPLGSATHGCKNCWDRLRRRRRRANPALRAADNQVKRESAARTRAAKRHQRAA